MNVRAVIFLFIPVLAVAQVSEFVGDQKALLSAPAALLESRNLIPVAAVIAASVSLVALDSTDEPFFRRTSVFNGFNRAFSSRATEIGTLAAPAALFATGLLRGDAKMQRTAFLAGEALGDAEMVALALKEVTRRASPLGNSDGSFPSGHTITAFAAATVVARHYGNHKWAPFVAYGLATAVGFSRVTSSAHFVSDVFIGGALGYTIGRFTASREP